MPRTNLVNAVDVALAVAVAAPDLTITVDDALPLPPVPFYLVVDPFNDTQGREYMLCTAVAVNVLTVTRSLAGSDSDVHDVGDIVRITIAAQHIEDLWTDIEAIPPPVPQTFLHNDLTDVGSSQHHTRYADSEAVAAVAAAAVYLPLAGGTMAGIINAGSFPLVNLLGPSDPTDAANKAYVDSVIVPQTFLHEDLTDVTADQHHAKYTDAEAIAAVGPHTAPQTFLHADLTDVGSLPSAHHTRYADSEAVAAMGALGDANPLNHTKATDPAGVYLPLAGGTLTGDLIIDGAKQRIVAAGGAIIEMWDSLNQAYVRTFENGPSQEMRFGVNGNNEVFRMTQGQMNSYGRILLVNLEGLASGYMEPFDGAGREVVRYGAGANSTDGNFWQVIGPNDTSPEQVAFRFSAVSGSGQPFSATPTRGPYTDMPAGAHGQFNMRNVAHSGDQPSGGIWGDIWLVI